MGAWDGVAMRDIDADCGVFFATQNHHTSA
jgi:hypothetical protein